MTGRIFENWDEQRYRELLGEELGAGRGGSFWARKTEESKNTQLKLAYLHFLIYYESSKKICKCRIDRWITIALFSALSV